MTGAGGTKYPFPNAEIVGSFIPPPKFPPPWSVVHVRSMSDVGLPPRIVPHAWFGLLRLKSTKRDALVPAATKCALLLTLMVTPCASATIAHGWMVTTALLPTVIAFGMRCVTPSPAQVSSAVMLAACVTVVPFAVPQMVAAVTVTTAEPLFVASAALVALMV